MGQTIGKARIHPGATSFVNLPKSLVHSLGQSVFEVSEGYGLSKNELKSIIQISLHEYMRLSDSLGECSDALFALFYADTPPGSKEELIDSFEFLAAICIVSAMGLHEKISFLFETFDISERGNLSVNETTLAFRACFSGTSKISASMKVEDYNVIDSVALEAFELSVPDSLKYSHAMTVEDHKLNMQDFFNYVSNCAETVSFLGYFDDILNEGRVKSCLEKELFKLTPLRFHVPERLKPSPDQPWKDQLRLLQPVHDDSESTQYPPASGLTLDWIHGRNARTSACYCSCGDVLYAAGSIVVKVSTNEDGACNQEYFMGHSGYVSSIDIFYMEEGGDMVATADVGRESKICVWSSSNLVPIVAIQSLHQCGISKLNFSPSGELLLTLDNGDANSIAVYNWRERKKIFTSKLSTDVYDCSFLSTDNSFGVCTREAVFFWTRSEPKMPYLRCRGVFDRLSTREVMTRISVVGSSVITLSLYGRIWVWEGRVCTQLVNLRNGPVTQLHAPRKNSNNIGICVSTHGGSIHLLDRNLEPLHDFRPNKQLDEAERIIDVVCCHPGYERVLFGQKKNCLYQMNAHDKASTAIVASGHPGIRGIFVKDKNVITVGANIIKIWNAKQHSCLRESCIDASLSCVSCNPLEDQIAVGFHADCPRSSLDKSFVILNGSDLRIIHHGFNSQETLTCCSYSNDGQLLVFGSCDSSIYVHQNTDKGFPLLTKIRGHSSQISRIDFGRCTGSQYLRSNSASGEAMFWTTGGKVCTPLSTRDTVWETQTCIYSAAFEKVHSSYDESNSKVTSCCPLPNRGGQSIIVGDSDGNIRVFAYPYTADCPLFLNYTGHSDAIQSIVVSADSYTVHTMSLRDSCLFQWKRTVLSWGQGLPIVTSKNGILPSNGSSSTEMDMESMIKQMDSLDFITSEGRKDSPHAVRRPWTRSIVAPSNFVSSELDLPEINLSLERIHGYSGNGIKNNLHALDDHGDMVYVVGKHLVRHNVEQNNQLFCNLNGEVSCLSIHRERHIGVIGLIDQQRASAIAIVDLLQMKSLTFLSNRNGGVACLNVDESGKYIVSVSNSREIVVHDWKNGCVVASSHTYGLETLDVKFLKGSSDRIIECGTCFIRFWSIHGCSLRFEEVTLDSLENQTQYYSCIGWNGDNIIVGSSTGQIVPFSGVEPGKRIKAHRSAVTNISSAKNGVLTCSNDSVKLWNSSMRCMLSIGTQDVGIKYSISSISWAKDAIMVGTSGNEIWQLSSDSESNLIGVCKVLVSSHASLPLGLSVSSNGSFATTGDDGVLRLWNVFDHQEITSFDLNMPSQSCAFSPDLLGRLIAVGFGKPEKENTRIVDGKWIVLSVSEGGAIRTIAERRDVKKHITEMKWHSSGDRLAVGSGDKKLCVYSMKSDTTPAVKVDITLISMIDLTSPPIYFDFSVDGKYLRANYECHELHFFEAGPGLHIKESSRLKDVHWETETCIFGWNVQGLWGKGDGAEIVSLDCTPYEPCPSIAAGDRCGDLKLSQFPFTSTKAVQYMTYPAHLGPVCKVRWLPGYLVSVGMKDNAIMIWRQEVGQGFADRQHLDVSFESPLVGINATSPSDEFVCHSALYDLVDQRVMYPLLGNVEVFDKRRHDTDVPIESFRKHDATVVAICASNSRLLVATADEKTIRLWDPQTHVEVATLSHERQRNISSLSFSSDDMKVVSASSGGLFVWIAMNGDWSDARLAFHTLAGREKVNFALFDAGRNSIVSGGRRHVNFWSERHSTLVLSKNCINETFVCGVSVNEKLLITGTMSGSFVIWEETKIVKEIQAHNGCVTSLRACPEGFISGCAQGVVILWSANLQKVASYDVFAKSTSSPIGSIDMISHSNRYETTKILVRTESRDIYEISCVTGKVFLLCKIGSSEAAPSAEPNPINNRWISSTS